jgi:uncharacterized protein
MKPSRYNFVFPLENDIYLLYNGLSGGFAKVDSSTLSLLESDQNSSDPQISFILENLKRGKFIVPDDFDELSYLKVLTNAARFKTNSLGVTIAPTLQCNFACSYCYEPDAHVTMNEETITSMKKFFESQINSIDGLAITWFGGEPLLTLDIIRNISQFILNLKKDIHYEAGIITNGYLLNQEAAKHLDEMQIMSVQITLDGPPPIHDKRRPLKNGKQTFSRILTNILDTIDMLKISLRVNVDEMNVDYVPEVLDILKAQGLAKKVKVYFAPVLDINSRCADVSASCMSYEVYSQHEIELYKKALEKGFNLMKYPIPLRGSCGAVSINSLLIDPYGDFHKCWNTVGVKNEKVGTLGEPLQLDSLLVQWLSWDPFEKEKCRACKFLPLCMGGCPYLSRTREINCNTWKYNLEEMLRLYYSSKLK